MLRAGNAEEFDETDGRRRLAPRSSGGAGLGMAATPMVCEAFSGRITADGSSGFLA
jgi:signal transduction histidine kinase